MSVKASTQGGGKKACQPRSEPNIKRIGALPSSADASALKRISSRLFALSKLILGAELVSPSLDGRSDQKALFAPGNA